MRHLVSYDITDDARRTKVAHLLEDFGTRVQYSVFECDLDEAKLLALRKQVLRLIEQDTDSVRVYRLCAACRESVEVLGAGRMVTEGRVQII